MNPRMRFWATVVPALGLGLLTAFQVANEQYLLAGLLVGAAIWLIATWRNGPLPEAMVIGVLLLGYLIGNRGFAQFLISPRIPLLPAEGALVVCVPALLIRSALKRTTGIHRDSLNLAILAWMTLGAARLPLDLRVHGFEALRDFATVYYATFFFIGQTLAAHQVSRDSLKRALTVGFAVLPVVIVVYQLDPGFFFSHLTWNGVPLVYHKSDLSAAFLAAGFFWLWRCRQLGGNLVWLVGAAACFALEATMESPRAAMVAIGVVTLLWVGGRYYRLVGFQVLVITLGLAVALPTSMMLKKDWKSSAAYSAYEHAISIVDIEGHGTYRHQASGDPGDNNRFRLVWWQAVADETIANNPLFGLGFGYDLAERFRVQYDWILNDEFSARSPHSVMMTVFGRMGAIGLLLWLAVAGSMAFQTITNFRRRDIEMMGLWSVAWALWVSACFGVVLEGPMGAVVFWTVLGVANACRYPADEALRDQTASATDPSKPATIESATPV
jgi:hypothetical protein